MNTNDKDSWPVNIELLRSSVNRYGIYGVIISVLAVVISTLIVSYQMTGQITVETTLIAQRQNIALRLLDFLPFIYAYWGQYVGAGVIERAGEMLVEETEDLRAETTSWKIKSLHNATHDSLTGLPNRAMFYDKLGSAMATAKQDGKSLSIVYLDLDNFKAVNEQFGPAFADKVLTSIATRLGRRVSEEDIVARIGGDEFAIILNDNENAPGGIAVARRIQQLLENPFEVKGDKVAVSASIGIACYPMHADNVDALLSCAELAMHNAKHHHDGYVVYADVLRDANKQRINLITDLKSAITNADLMLYYQPKINIQSGQVYSAEALLRWRHPEYGYISPEEFIPLAERSRLIRPMTNLVIKQAMQRLDEWRKSGIDIDLGINISARDLEAPDLITFLSDEIKTTGIDPESLTLEVTESCIMNDPVKSLAVLESLSRDLGLKLAIDDFGTGYSSLAYLSQMPVDELKIDQSFVRGMETNENNRLIVNATIDLGHRLNMSVTAEGIENTRTWQMLADMGCDSAQGYLMSPPLEESEFMKWLAESRWRKTSAN